MIATIPYRGSCARCGRDIEFRLPPDEAGNSPHIFVRCADCGQTNHANRRCRDR